MKLRHKIALYMAKRALKRAAEDGCYYNYMDVCPVVQEALEEAGYQRYGSGFCTIPRKENLCAPTRDTTAKCK